MPAAPSSSCARAGRAWDWPCGVWAGLSPGAPGCSRVVREGFKRPLAPPGSGVLSCVQWTLPAVSAELPCTLGASLPPCRAHGLAVAQAPAGQAAAPCHEGVSPTGAALHAEPVGSRAGHSGGPSGPGGLRGHPPAGLRGQPSQRQVSSGSGAQSPRASGCGGHGRGTRTEPGRGRGGCARQKGRRWGQRARGAPRPGLPGTSQSTCPRPAGPFSGPVASATCRLLVPEGGAGVFAAAPRVVVGPGQRDHGAAQKHTQLWASGGSGSAIPREARGTRGAGCRPRKDASTLSPRSRPPGPRRAPPWARPVLLLCRLALGSAPGAPLASGSGVRALTESPSARPRSPARAPAAPS